MGIATIAVLVAAVGMFSSHMTIQISQDTSTSSLQEVTEKVSSEIIDLVDLSSLNPQSNLTLYRVIDIPDQINNYGYVINLQNDTLGWKVVAYLNEYNTVRAESNLYFKGGVGVVNGTGILNVKYNGQSVVLSYGKSLYSGTYRPVVWCQINQSIITVGLGSLGVTGG
jgi:hypothetical protein